jgi:hypothetical protein
MLLEMKMKQWLWISRAIAMDCRMRCTYGRVCVCSVVFGVCWTGDVVLQHSACLQCLIVAPVLYTIARARLRSKCYIQFEEIPFVPSMDPGGPVQPLLFLRETRNLSREASYFFTSGV